MMNRALMLALAMSGATPDELVGEAERMAPEPKPDPRPACPKCGSRMRQRPDGLFRCRKDGTWHEPGDSTNETQQP